MVQSVFAPNPFHHQGPIRDPEIFFDRERDVKKVLSYLRRGQSVFLVGKEKIGKTSFLHHVSNPEVATRHGLTCQMLLFFYVDCKPLASLDEGARFSRIKAIMETEVAKEDLSLALSLECIACLTAYEWLIQAFSLFQDKHIRAIVQLDDFDELAAAVPLSIGFLSNLRALGDVRMSYLATSRVPLFQLQGRVAENASSPFFNIFRPCDLQPFIRDESRKFLVTRLESVEAAFGDSALDFICDLGRDGPYQLQLSGACAYDVWCKHAGSLREEHFLEIEERFEDESQSVCRGP